MVSFQGYLVCRTEKNWSLIGYEGQGEGEVSPGLVPHLFNQGGGALLCNSIGWKNGRP